MIFFCVWSVANFGDHGRPFLSVVSFPEQLIFLRFIPHCVAFQIDWVFSALAFIMKGVLVSFHQKYLVNIL